jgi:hypothetical protein
MQQVTVLDVTDDQHAAATRQLLAGQKFRNVREHS